MASISNLKSFPSLNSICSAVLDVWPQHESFLSMRFANPSDYTIPLVEEMAELVVQIAGNDMPAFAECYRWTCEALIAEDLHFRRTGSYRWASFEEANREVYSRVDYMQKYLCGLLLSQVLWANQAAAFYFYVERFLARLKPGADFLEIGPGHGLLMYFAARSLQISTITGWDVSESSLMMTRKSLETVGVRRPFTLKSHNILEPSSVFGLFDAVVLSEVLEHLDRPEVALALVLQVMKPGGLAFFNVPVNSPAPDHIYHWGSPVEVEELIRSAGFKIIDSDAAPTTGYSLERARARKVTINSLIVATPRG